MVNREKYLYKDIKWTYSFVIRSATEDIVDITLSDMKSEEQSVLR